MFYLKTTNGIQCMKLNGVVFQVNKESDLDRINTPVWITWNWKTALRNKISYYVEEYNDKDLKEYVASLGVKNELEALVKIFELRKDTFNTKVRLWKEFKKSNFRYSMPRFIECLIDFKFPKKTKEKDYKILDFIKLKKYPYVLEFFKNKNNYGSKLDVMIAGVEHRFGWGGLHGARKKVHIKGNLIHIDINRNYPTLLNTYFPIDDPIIKKIHYYNSTKTGAERIPYKLADNAIIGKFKDKKSKLYNPALNNSICVNGQLILLMLIEMLEPYSKIIQTNTDGIIIEAHNEKMILEEVKKWEEITRLTTKISYHKELLQKDVNNYILDGKSVGYTKINPLRYHGVVIKKAMLAYLDGVSPREYLKTNKEIRDYQYLHKGQVYYNAGLSGYTLRDDQGYKVADMPKVTSYFEKRDDRAYIEEIYKKLKEYGI
ncbi:hypothetical protein IR073_06560 [Gemella sp. 19428wG2_WT2a]|nr:hypothetical protein [Gemella sp. 19428wG2_WT2a]TFU57698.1 hypothetical protein E4T67_06485 [Gemella sp. WT2a]